MQRSLELWALIPLTLLASLVLFSLVAGLGLEWADEGEIAYFSWLTAEGDLPYRDFQNLYGPSIFWLNGTLFRQFGVDLSVLRALVVLLKTATVLFTTLSVRRVASLPVTLLCLALLLLVWARPWAFSRTPYASYYAFALVLLGVWIFLATMRRPQLACALAGLCCGAAATFKQTAGFFPFLALMLYLATDRTDTDGMREPGPRVARLASPLRPLVLVATFAVSVGYVARLSGLVDFLILASPLGVAFGLYLVGELREPVTPALRLESARRMAALSTGAALPLAAWALYYLARGQLGDLAFNTVADLPAAIHQYVPASTPFADLAAAAGWQGGAVAVIALLPWLGTWLALAPGVRAVGGAARGPGAGRLFLLLASTGLCYLHPAADAPHIFLAFPLFVPALAVGLEHLLAEGRAARSVRRVALLLVAASLCFSAAPLLRGLRWAGPPTPRPGLARATGVRIVHPVDWRGVELVESLRSRDRERPLLALSGRPMFNFLSGRRSPVQEIDFLLYLISFDLLSEEHARSWIDQQAVIDRLERTRPILIEDDLNDAAQRLRRVLPRLGSYLDARYRTEASFGSFRLLERRGGPPGRTP